MRDRPWTALHFYVFSRVGVWGILFLSCLSFCNSLNLSETFTLLITFEQWVWDRALIIFQMSIPLYWQDVSVVTNIFDTVTLTLEFNILFVNFYLTYNYRTMGVIKLWYFTWVFLFTRSFCICGYQNFWPCDLDLRVCLPFE